MELLLTGLVGALTGAVTMFAFEAYRRDVLASELKRLKDEAKKKGEPTMDCRELLHDLTEGAALVKITRISPLDVYLRRS